MKQGTFFPITVNWMMIPVKNTVILFRNVMGRMGKVMCSGVKRKALNTMKHKIYPFWPSTLIELLQFFQNIWGLNAVNPTSPKSYHFLSFFILGPIS